jgi:TM2 domain-containing membrane protein YozV
VESLRRQEQADTVVVAARRAFVRGDAGAAREQIKQAFAIDTSNAAGLELLGDIFLSEAEQEKAIQVFQRGAQKHPDKLVFEEKIGLALLDIEEEKRDKEIAAMLLADPNSLRWAERKPGLAASLSMLVPGAGQFYNDEPERGGVLMGSAILLFGGWYWIFNSATSNVPGRRIMTGAGEAISQMGVLAKLGFWALLLAWLAVVAYAVTDAYQGARNANRAHRPFEV